MRCRIDVGGRDGARRGDDFAGDVFADGKGLRGGETRPRHGRSVAKEFDADEARVLLKNHSIARDGPRGAGRGADKHEGGADVRMAGKRQLGARGKNANLRRIGSILRRQHEGGFGKIEFRRDRLHLCRREAARVRHDGERIAAELPIGEDVDGGEIEFHGAAAPHPGSSGGTPGGILRALVACSNA